MYQKLKLEIIQQVLACQEEDILQTVRQLLQTLPNEAKDAPQPNALHQALLGEPTIPTISPSEKDAPHIDHDIQELQQNIKDIFG